VYLKIRELDGAMVEERDIHNIMFFFSLLVLHVQVRSQAEVHKLRRSQAEAVTYNCMLFNSSISQLQMQSQLHDSAREVM
jgi:hypothetical protein